jgi:hypothetical protein
VVSTVEGEEGEGEAEAGGGGAACYEPDWLLGGGHFLREMGMGEVGRIMGVKV